MALGQANSGYRKNNDKAILEPLKILLLHFNYTDYFAPRELLVKSCFIRSHTESNIMII